MISQRSGRNEQKLLTLNELHWFRHEEEPKQG